MATRPQGIQQVVESITTLALIDSRELYGRKSAAEPRAGLGERGAGLGRRPQGPPPRRALREGSRPPVRALPCLQATPATHGISELALEPSRPPLTPPEVPSLGHTTASHDSHSGLALAPVGRRAAWPQRPSPCHLISLQTHVLRESALLPGCSAALGALVTAAWPPHACGELCWPHTCQPGPWAAKAAGPRETPQRQRGVGTPL